MRQSHYAKSTLRFHSLAKQRILLMLLMHIKFLVGQLLVTLKRNGTGLDIVS